MPRYLEAVYPGSRSDVLEIDPGVTLTATEKLGLRTGNGIQVTHGDARTTLRSVPSGGYDLVYGDAFNDMAVPWHLTTAEFATEVRRVLRPDGIYAINIIDTWPRGGFLAAFFRTLQDVFPHVLLVRTNGVAGSPDGAGGSGGAGGLDAAELASDVLDNWVVLASAQPIDSARLERVSRPAVEGSEPARARVVPEADICPLARRAPAAGAPRRLCAGGPTARRTPPALTSVTEPSASCTHHAPLASRTTRDFRSFARRGRCNGDRYRDVLARPKVPIDG